MRTGNIRPPTAPEKGEDSLAWKYLMESPVPRVKPAYTSTHDEVFG